MSRKQFFFKILKMKTDELLKTRLVYFEKGCDNILKLSTDIHTFIALMILLGYIDRHPFLQSGDHKCL